jgi:hypothetical protein
MRALPPAASAAAAAAGGGGVAAAGAGAAAAAGVAAAAAGARGSRRRSARGGERLGRGGAGAGHGRARRTFSPLRHVALGCVPQRQQEPGAHRSSTQPSPRLYPSDSPPPPLLRPSRAELEADIAARNAAGPLKGRLVCADISGGLEPVREGGGVATRAAGGRGLRLRSKVGHERLAACLQHHSTPCALDPTLPSHPPPQIPVALWNEIDELPSSSGSGGDGDSGPEASPPGSPAAPAASVTGGGSGGGGGAPAGSSSGSRGSGGGGSASPERRGEDDTAGGPAGGGGGGAARSWPLPPSEVARVLQTPGYVSAGLGGVVERA